MTVLIRTLLVAVGGAIGSAARLGVALAVPSVGGLPLATLIVNLVGAFLIGVLSARIPATTNVRVFLGTGILGGFTTYSAFTVGTTELWGAQPVLAVVYAAGSIVFGFLAAAAGLRVARPRDAVEERA